MKIDSKKAIRIALLWLLSTASGFAQNSNESKFIKPEDRSDLTEQTKALYEQIQPAVREASLSTVEILNSHGRFIAAGTVVEKETVLVKMSEVLPTVQYGAQLQCQVRNESGYAVELKKALLAGAYQQFDLAVLKVSGLQAPPIQWKDAVSPELGSFLALALPQGKVGALGVVSVRPRSFLGVSTDPNHKGKGCLIKEVVPETAAHEAGLQAGDQIITIEGQSIRTSFDLIGTIMSLEVGQKINMTYLRNGQKKQAQVLLDERAHRRTPQSRRSTIMRRLGTDLSHVNEGFPSALFSDMPIQPEYAGAPVVNRTGEAVGLAIARTSRIRTTIIPSQTILELLKTDPQEIKLRIPSRRNHSPRHNRRENSFFDFLFRKMLEE